MQTQQLVSWNTYARQYDMLFDYNPFYQQLHQEVMEEVRQWNIDPGAVLADVGAGTGNYSLAMARYFPQATVLHVDKDEGMNARAADKKSRWSLANHVILCSGVDELSWPAGSLQGLISIHALYTFSDPTKVLRSMWRWLAPGGCAVLVNAGRIVKILDWQLAIGRYLLRRYGIKKTLQILREGKEVSRQNAYIRAMQRKGVFWTHTHKEFTQAVQSAGFEITSHKVCFRGISDFVVARKAG